MAIDWTKIYQKYKGKWVALKSDEKTVINAYDGEPIGMIVDGEVRIDASTVLDLVAKLISGYPNISVNIAAYTNASGSARSTRLGYTPTPSSSSSATRRRAGRSPATTGW